MGEAASLPGENPPEARPEGAKAVRLTGLKKRLSSAIMHPVTETEARLTRCSCKVCDTYMIQAESDHLGCVCPTCGYRCNDCLGTDTVVSRDHLASLAQDPRFSPENLAANFERRAEEDWEDEGGYER